MLSSLRAHASAANVMSFLALAVALGGTSYAAVTIGTAQIRRGAVTHSRLHRNAVMSMNVKDRSLLARDFKRGQLRRGATGPTGPSGATGPQGLRGSTGATGAAGTAHAYARVYQSSSLPGRPLAFYPGATKGFTSIVAGISGGLWCLTPAAGIDARALPAVVSPRIYTYNADVMLRVDATDGAAGGDCPGHPGYVVSDRYAQSVGGAAADADFNIIVP